MLVHSMQFLSFHKKSLRGYYRVTGGSPERKIQGRTVSNPMVNGHQRTNATSKTKPPKVQSVVLF